MGKLKDLFKRGSIWYLQSKTKGLAQIKLNGPVVILVPHPDDEVFGCGGLLARMVTENNIPHLIVLTGGGASHASCCDTSKEDIIKARRLLTREAAGEIGLPEEYIHELDFKDGQVTGDFGNEYERLKSLLKELNPKTILIPHHGEGWPDHLAAGQIGLGLAPEDIDIYEYCVWMWYYHQSRLDWNNAFVLRMTPEEHRRKLAAIKAYYKPTAPCGKPWVGVLPPLFVKANSTACELYFKKS